MKRNLRGKRGGWFEKGVTSLEAEDEAVAADHREVPEAAGGRAPQGGGGPNGDLMVIQLAYTRNSDPMLTQWGAGGEVKRVYK